MVHACRARACIGHFHYESYESFICNALGKIERHVHLHQAVSQRTSLSYSPMQGKGSTQEMTRDDRCVPCNCARVLDSSGAQKDSSISTALKHMTTQRCIFCGLTEPASHPLEARRQIPSRPLTSGLCQSDLITIPAVAASAVILGTLPCLAAPRQHPHRLSVKTPQESADKADCRHVPCLSEAVVVLLPLFVVCCIPAKTLDSFRHKCFQAQL